MFSWIADRLYITRRYPYFLGAAVLAALAALHGCGGGGGGGGGDGGSSEPSYSLSSSSVSFSANQGGATPPPQIVTVTVTSGTLFFKTSQTGNTFGHTFSLTGPTTGQITITPGVTFNAGAFSGTITVHACTDAFCQNDIAGSPKTIDVAYTVTGLSVAPTAINFESTTGQAATPQDVTLSLIPGGSASWTSSINYTSAGTSGWLTLGPATGPLDSPQTVSLIVNAPPVSAEVRTATVTFSAGPLTQSVAVTYTISSPRVDFVAPYVQAADVDGSVIVRGHGFFGLNSPNATVEFGASGTSTALILSDTEIRASYPALTAGSYDIKVSDGVLTLNTRSGVKLLLVDPLPSSAQTTIGRSGGAFAANDLIYDAERKALYLMDQQANRLERYQFNGTNWPMTPMVFAGGGIANRRIALSPDGTLLLKTSDASVLERIDTATFTALPGDDAAPVGSNSLNRIAFANDGTAIGNSAGATKLYRYDMLRRHFVPLGTEFNLQNRHIAASADGDTLVLTSEVLGSGGSNILTYDASNGTLTEMSAGNSTTSGVDNEKVSISRDGSKTLLISPDPSGSGSRPVVYDASFAALGRLPVGLNGFVLKPDGSAAYGYYPGTTSVRKFDLTVPPDVGGVFPEMGSGTVVVSPGSTSTAMTMSPDGTALFLAGDQQVIVLPAP